MSSSTHHTLCVVESAATWIAAELLHHHPVLILRGCTVCGPATVLHTMLLRMHRGSNTPRSVPPSIQHSMYVCGSTHHECYALTVSATHYPYGVCATTYKDGQQLVTARAQVGWIPCYRMSLGMEYTLILWMVGAHTQGDTML